MLLIEKTPLVARDYCELEKSKLKSARATLIATEGQEKEGSPFLQLLTHQVSVIGFSEIREVLDSFQEPLCISSSI